MRRLLLLVAVLSLVAAACSDPAAADDPPEITYGRDICIECGMIIGDARFAAAYRLGDGTEHTFDDLGGLILFGRETGDLDVARVWVSDFDDEVLIEAGSAYFVPTRGVVSPMGHGILAFADGERANATAAELGGEVIDWETVKVLPVTEGLVGHHHDDDHG